MAKKPHPLADKIKVGMSMHMHGGKAFIGGIDDPPGTITKSATQDMNRELAAEAKRLSNEALSRYVQDNRGKNLLTGKPY